MLPAIPPPRHITVTGEAQVIASPNQALLTIGLETSNQKLPAAKTANDELLQQVLAVAQQAGLAAKHIQTDYTNIEPRHRWQHSTQVFAGYFVRRTLLLTLENLAGLERLITDLLTAGVGHIHQVDFRTTALKQYRDEARALALQAAQAKAQAMAATLGQQVGQPLVIREDKDDWHVWRAARWWGGSGAEGLSQNVSQHLEPNATAEGGTALGKITVRANVTVTFALE